MQQLYDFSCTMKPQMLAVTTDSQQTGEKRQCWECQRRRLVCDSTRPICTKCSASGVVCPGYDDKRPLRWLAPGKVKSRTRRKKSPAAMEMRKTTDHLKVTVHRIAEDPHRVVVPGSFIGKEYEAVLEATSYYNFCIYPENVASQLKPNPFFVAFPEAAIPRLPPSVSHALVCLLLGHRIRRLPISANVGSLVKRHDYHRGLAIRALNEDIGDEERRMKDATISGVMMLLASELMEANATKWQDHVNGAMTLVALRGGHSQLLRSPGGPKLQMVLVYFIIIGVIGNTTSPMSNQVPHMHLIDLITKLYGEVHYPTFPCPPSLFLDIIRINHLRSWGSVELPAEPTAAALDLLQHINSFSPEKWAESNLSYQEEWLLIGRIYQSAVALYCIATLPITPDAQTKGIRASCSRRLSQLLEKCVSCSMTKRYVLWPIIVAGFDAVHNGSSVQTQIAEWLEVMSRDIGSGLPLCGKAVLESFWSSGKTEWDECFHGMYVFAW
ncbi:fungal-specific transcription factor domain-containing protein [Pseudomassariella vexata]|uniref:Fungal-specific transcription factor domain-domain-containing protein n=1 Tax=Pseudomassariella vexata TaxID=1141098 RepID=A0A1Y2DVJ3_9PEZI|nr:fungal-specific transcription factor domain-containing protein [Pseudomassariella vexata]ORY63268.1 fungal-specific transcription factor domain-domain-containing protein [Pseudomassariella vexata]